MSSRAFVQCMLFGLVAGCSSGVIGEAAGTFNPGTSDASTQDASWLFDPVENDSLDPTLEHGAHCGNGLDDNGNTVIDEGCSCAQGSTQPCYPAPWPVGGLKGKCKKGTQTCEIEPSQEFSNHWGKCMGAVIPVEEKCDAARADDDCDGLDDVAEGLVNKCGGCSALMGGQPGTPCGDPACGSGKWTCTGSGVNQTVCMNDPQPSAANCGGCGPLQGGGPVGAPCGDTACGRGTFVCAGPNTVTCANDPKPNNCGECGVPNRPPGVSCSDFVLEAWTSGDCSWVECPGPGEGNPHPHPVQMLPTGCTVVTEGGTPWACVANILGNSNVFFKEGKACDAGNVQSARVFCRTMSSPVDINAANCPVTNTMYVYPSGQIVYPSDSDIANDSEFRGCPH